MPQSQYKSNKELKSLARVQINQRLGLLIGAILLNAAILFVSVNVVSLLCPANTLIGYIINYILLFVVQIASCVLNVGISLIFLKSACGMPSTISDLFYGFQHNFTKILQIGTLICIVQAICMIPFDIASVHLTEIITSNPLFINYNTNSLTSMTVNNAEFWQAYSIMTNAMMKYYFIMLVCTIISTILTLPFFPAFYMILDFPDWSVSTIVKRCFEVMNGNKLRLFIFYMSFIPIYLLSIVTCGLALIWIIPYCTMATTNFYLDLMAVRNKSLSH